MDMIRANPVVRTDLDERDRPQLVRQQLKGALDDTPEDGLRIVRFLEAKH
jgi:hypothetical protein